MLLLHQYYCLRLGKERNISTKSCLYTQRHFHFRVLFKKTFSWISRIKKLVLVSSILLSSRSPALLVPLKGGGIPLLRSCAQPVRNLSGSRTTICRITNAIHHRVCSTHIAVHLHCKQAVQYVILLVLRSDKTIYNHHEVNLLLAVLIAV